MPPAVTAYELKERGNKAFKDGDFEMAETLYTQAAIKDPSNHLIFSNRAQTRLKLSRWEGVLADTETALRIDPKWMKAYHFQADANIALRRPHDAVRAAKSAYGLCLAFPKKFGRDAMGTCELVLRSKKALWESRERERVRGLNELLDECLAAIRAAGAARERDLKADADAGRIGPQTLAEEVRDLRAETQGKEERLRGVFAAEDPELRHREVPECYIDRISFNFMIDPAVTTYGHSYERAHIMAHLEHNQVDPLTGTRMTVNDIRPNLALRDACEAYLEKNGWAVDY